MAESGSGDFFANVAEQGNRRMSAADIAAREAALKGGNPAKSAQNGRILTDKAAVRGDAQKVVPMSAPEPVPAPERKPAEQAAERPVSVRRHEGGAGTSDATAESASRPVARRERPSTDIASPEDAGSVTPDARRRSPGRPVTGSPAKNPAITERQTIPGVPAALVQRARNLFCGTALEGVSVRDIVEAVLALYMELDPKEFDLDPKAVTLVEDRKSSLSSTENINRQVRMLGASVRDMRSDMAEVRLGLSHLIADYRGWEAMDEEEALSDIDMAEFETAATTKTEGKLREEALAWDAYEERRRGRVRPAERARGGHEDV